MSTQDLSTIKPGGKVSVTLDDGTKIIDSPVTQGPGDVLWCASELVILSRDGHALRERIVAIDAYTPPKPKWDRPEVYAVDVPGVGAYCRHPKRAAWWVRMGGQSKDLPTTDPASGQHSEAMDTFHGVTVLAVYAEGVSR